MFPAHALAPPSLWCEQFHQRTEETPHKHLELLELLELLEHLEILEILEPLELLEILESQKPLEVTFQKKKPRWRRKESSRG